MKRTSTGRLLGYPLVAVLGSWLLGAGVAPAAHAQNIIGSGQAFGTEVTIEGLIESDKTALTGMGCTLGTLFRENSVTGVNAAPALSTGVVHTTVRRQHLNGGSTIRVQSTSEVAGVSILGGVVSASAIYANAVTERDSSGSFSTRSTGSTFADLNLLGIPLDITPPPNTTLDLLGFGSVSFNEQIRDVRPNRASRLTRMIHVVISLPNPLVPIGTEITVASARAVIGQGGGLLGGGAFGGSLEVGNVALIDKLLRIGMPCGGTGGDVESRSGVALDLPGVLDSGTITNTVQGDNTPGAMEAITTSTIEGANLLLNLVSADVIKARARIHGTLDNFSRGTAGSQFVNIEVAGFPAINDNVPVNTHLDILGLGDLWIKRRIHNPRAVQIRMIQVLVLENNVLGLPVGADLRVAQAAANFKEP